MSIAKLTSDDLRETARENTQLAKLNELVDAMNNITGDGTPAAGTFTTVAANGASGSRSVDARNSATGQTASVDIGLFYGTGTFNCTAAERQCVAVSGAATASRSTGANSLTNYGGLFQAAGGQVNYALHAALGGDVFLAGASDKLGFYGTAPIAKQTGVAVSAAGVHAALVALGLIGV